MPDLQWSGERLSHLILIQFHVPLAFSQHSNCVCNRYCFSSFRMRVCASVFFSFFHPSGRSPSSPIFFTGLHWLASVPWTFVRGNGYVTRILPILDQFSHSKLQHGIDAYQHRVCNYNLPLLEDCSWKT